MRTSNESVFSPLSLWESWINSMFEYEALLWAQFHSSVQIFRTSPLHFWGILRQLLSSNPVLEKTRTRLLVDKHGG
jgi:hypothetical protein